MKLPTWLAYVALLGVQADAYAERRGPAPPAPVPAPTPARAPIVMLDPGHGGSNAGAKRATSAATIAAAIAAASPGDDGLTEKRLTLALAGRVADRLRARGVDARLTRADDRTLTLRRRVELANRAPADLFVSLHANASASHARRGFETYVLTAQGVDVDGRALRGDAATPRPAVDPETALVLDDVERGAAQWGAAELAARMQRALRARRGAAGDRGVRQDAHHVLLGATMPAVLVEVGFLDHPLEGKELADPRVQDQLADAIAEAILDQLAD